MSKILGQVDILNLNSGDTEEALVYDGINEKHLHDYDNLWSPILNKKAQKIWEHNTNSGKIDKINLILELGEFGVQDYSWNWKELCEDTLGKLMYRTFAIECDDKLQGLMLVNLGIPCKLNKQINMPMVYIERLAVAPWNRIRLNKGNKYKYVGKVLIATAISLSIDEDFGGRIGLHSLPQACEYYEDKVGMINLGPDKTHQDLVYYEMTSKQAKQFLNSKK